MPNHIHMLVYVRQPGAMGKCMRSVMTSYSRYFNTKYHRSGSLFESRYKASMISDRAYLEHISRYIHLNPKQWRHYEYSGLPYYLQQDEVSWLRPKRILEMFNGTAEYLEFVSNYAEQKKLRDILKQELALKFSLGVEGLTLSPLVEEIVTCEAKSCHCLYWVW